MSASFEQQTKWRNDARRRALDNGILKMLQWLSWWEARTSGEPVRNPWRLLSELRSALAHGKGSYGKGRRFEARGEQRGGAKVLAALQRLQRKGKVQLRQRDGRRQVQLTVQPIERTA